LSPSISESPTVAETPASTENVDYPRPAPPGGDHVPPPHEEEIPKREKKHDHRNYENEKRLRDTQRKVEPRPTRDAQAGGKSFGGAGRIAQPASKGFA
jgi:hypothetical protein